jgi:hypothetical protein
MTSDVLTLEAIDDRRRHREEIQRVTFGVSALYGLSRHSVLMPLGGDEAIESGQVCITLDPEAPSSQNLGIADFERNTLVVTYGIQAVFPGLYALVTQGHHDPGLLHPVRATATDECSMTPDLSGWRALGCLRFLPGSLWSGAEGG